MNTEMFPSIIGSIIERTSETNDEGMPLSRDDIDFIMKYF